MDFKDEFLDWLRSSGAYISPKIDIKDYSNEGARLGVVALENITKDEVLFTVPPCCILTAKSTKFRDEIRKKCKGSGWIPLMWAIILEKLSGSESFWKPYFDILPENVYLPSVWTSEDRALLQGTGLDSQIPDSSTQFKKYFLPLKANFSPTAEIKDQEFERLFHFAGCLISAYSFEEENGGRVAIVPLADTLNHRTGHNNARLYFSDATNLKMTCHVGCAAGQQLFNTYGDLGNEKLLLRYGFVDDPNPFHSISFDPIEELRPLMVEFFSSSASSEKRICDFDEASFALFDQYLDEVPCEVSAQECFDLDGLKGLLDWCHLLSRPFKSLNKLPKPKSKSLNYQSLLSHEEPTFQDLVISILQSRLSRLPSSNGQSAVDATPCFGPLKCVETIKKMDREILNGYIEFLQEK